MQNNGHTPEWTGPTVERVLGNGKRIYASAFKAWLIEQAGKPGISIASLALRHGINANLLRNWMRLQPRPVPPSAPVLLPVTITPSLKPAAPLASTTAAIEIELGGAIVRLQGSVDAQRLRLVLDVLRA
jgi:transposase